MPKAILICLAAMWLGSCATLQPEPSIPVGSQFEHAVKVGGKYIPLPPGKWVVRGSSTTYSTMGTPLSRVVLMNKGARLNPTLNPSIIYVSTNSAGSLTPSSTGWAVSKICSRTNVHHVVATDAYVHKQECWFVNHVRMTRKSTNSEAVLQAYDYAKSKGLAISGTTLSVGYRISDPSEFLSVYYYFDPEHDGFDPPTNINWSSSEWHVDRINRDPKKVAYVESLKKWGAAWLPKVKSGFNRNPIVVKQSIPNAPDKSTTPSSTADRLKQLQDMRNRGLITPEEFARKRKQIIDSL